MPEPESDEPSGLGLSLPQVAGSALAAVSAAVAASWLGVAGTIIGAALGSVVGTVGSAIYAQSLRRGGDAVRRFRPSRDGHEVIIGEPAWRQRLAELPWRRIVVASALVLGLALATITLVEQIGGKPVSDLTGKRSGEGTTIGRVFDGPRGAEQQSPAPQDEPAEPAPGPADQPGQDPSQAPVPSQEPTPGPTDQPTQPGQDPAPTDQPSDQPTPTAPTAPEESLSAPSP